MKVLALLLLLSTTVLAQDSLHSNVWFNTAILDTYKPDSSLRKYISDSIMKGWDTVDSQWGKDSCPYRYIYFLQDGVGTPKIGEFCNRQEFLEMKALRNYDRVEEDSISGMIHYGFTKPKHTWQRIDFYGNAEGYGNNTAYPNRQHKTHIVMKINGYNLRVFGEEWFYDGTTWTTCQLGRTTLEGPYGMEPIYKICDRIRHKALNYYFNNNLLYCSDWYHPGTDWDY